MFLLPEFIGKGLGKKMFKHLLKKCKAEEIKKLCILADPNSRIFYEKMECKYQMEYPSTIENRTTPLLTLRLNNFSKGGFVYDAEKNKNHRHHF